MKKSEISETIESQMCLFDEIAKNIVIGKRVILMLNDKQFSLLPTFIESRITKLLSDKYGYMRQLKTVKLTGDNFKEQIEQPYFIRNSIIFCKKNLLNIFSETFKNSPFDVYYI